ncbi:hypothetical protein CsatB_029764 [Cannabis sativa]|uniref:uncharacterized protein LOC115720379 n=1 Tax=Cannabis sativa TaxID=3483 RepID=UPI0011DF5B36|nr:uncharacterized protein LOC115720379 [Cannabis sativa]
MWLAMLNRLKTQNRLIKFGVKVNGTCCLCDVHPENCQHLFFDCKIDRHCLLEVKNWLNWHAQTSNLPQLIRWIGKARISKFKKKVLAAATAALVYSLWKSKIAVIWKKSLINPARIIEDIKGTLKIQIAMFMPRKVKNINRDWVFAL